MILCQIKEDIENDRLPYSPPVLDNLRLSFVAKSMRHGKPNNMGCSMLIFQRLNRLF